ncbi:MAG: hypothetical protein KGK08_14160 [Acidobacteriota bacterium]|nr:hypothetical protein [Acidobacteriota bacterium]
MAVRDYSAPQVPIFHSELVNPLNDISFRRRMRSQPYNDLDEQPLPPPTVDYETEDRNKPSVSSF